MTPSLVCAAAVLVLLAAGRFERPRLAGAAKCAASLAFLWAALEFGALGSGYGRWLFAGLALCAVGDVLLIGAGAGSAFLLGLGAFLLGHVAYALAFATSWPVSLAAGGGAVLAMALVGLAVWRWLAPHVPADFVWPVRAYLLVISLMVVAAVGASAAGAPLAIGVGAVGFAASDVSVARDRFVASAFVNGAWGLPLYYGSQLLLAASLL